MFEPGVGLPVLPDASIAITISNKQFCGPPVTVAGISSTVTVCGSVIFIIFSHCPVVGLNVYPGGQIGISLSIVLVVKKWLMLGNANSGCQSWNEIQAFALGS